MKVQTESQCTAQMPTGGPPEKPTDSPPDGMWFEERWDKPRPFLARWRTTDGKKTSRSFPEAKKRTEFAAAWAKQRARFGAAAQLVEQRTVAVWAEFRELVGDAHPLTVAREWLQFRGTADSTSIDEAWASFNADQEQRKLSPDTHSHRRLHGKRLCAFFTGKSAAAISTDELDAWLASMVAESKTKAHHLKTARHFFDWLKDRRKILHNPADAVTVPDASKFDDDGNPIHRDINILTLDEARRLFSSNLNAVCVGRLALEAFGGLRYSSAARLKTDDIRWDDCGIVLPGPQHKSTKRHYVDGWPLNLFAWMRHAPKACWELKKRDYLDLKRDAFVRAGLKPDEPDDGRAWSDQQLKQIEDRRNVLRHSFATYHLAAFKNAPLTAELMTKTSVRSLKHDYQGRATTADGIGFCSIAPKDFIP